MTPRRSAALRLPAALVLAAVFLAAAAPKLADPDAFAVAVARYRLLPDTWISLAAIWIPPLEVVAAVALLLPRWRRAGAGLLALLLAGFTAAMLSAAARGLEIGCGCFRLTAGADPIGPWSFARNAVLLGLATWLLKAPSPDSQNDRA